MSLENQRARASLRESEEHYRAAAEAATDAIISIDSDSTNTYRQSRTDERVSDKDWARGFSPWIDFERNLAGVLSVSSSFSRAFPEYLTLKVQIRRIVSLRNQPRSPAGESKD